ncbi:MAG: hypothetical protein KJ900_04570 [Proteobacteria bacterium]|nr:hypothetical protein [Desulfocapsa sp.]MBU3946073.1 hypothetical protein [Pseudomonadota bacterium]MCG2744773.1 hypothetical protein [Desulfobacteraceae bacterium]MBU4028383.1 hypothetical protein [Pseudomonadota bacterium]MBU4042158.1 hypothetical protein [Pseudomonadota bacterium]
MYKVKLSNKSILKNTMLLYIRMGLVLLVTLYSSRIILQELGVVDFGIYNLVAGFVIMFFFFGSSLSNSAQRFLNYQYGLGDEVEANHVFNMACFNFFAMSVIVVVILETLGLWFINNKLVIPIERLPAANLVFHFSVLSVFFTINSYIYDAVIIARERMQVYAYVGILEAVGRLIIAYVLIISSHDKLVHYAFLYMVVTLLVGLVKMIYCSKNFTESKISFYWNSDLFKQMFSFIGWNAFTALTEAINQQGISVLLNIFMGPTINAARGISYQISNALLSFSQNIYTAARPQMVKAYAVRDMTFFFKTINLSSKFTYYLLMLLAIPLILNIDFILNTWLTVVPKYTSGFSILIIIYTLVDSLKNPLWAAVQSVGNLKGYSLLGGIVFLMNFPVAYIFLAIGFPPQSVYFGYIIVRLVYLYVILRVIKKLLPEFDLKNYMHIVIAPIIFVTMLAPIAPLTVSFFVEGVMALIVVSVVSTLSSILAIYFVGLSREEQVYICSFLEKKLGY